MIPTSHMNRPRNRTPSVESNPRGPEAEIVHAQQRPVDSTRKTRYKVGIFKSGARWIASLFPFWKVNASPQTGAVIIQ